MNPTQTQTQSGPQVPAGLDPTAYILTKAIGYQENGGQTPDYTAKGASGEYGAYQYLPATWQARATQFLGSNAPSLQDATPDQQNEVTYKWVQSKLAAGYTPAQVASMHNAGEGAPNAWQGNAGTNAEGVQYNTKAYAQGVQKYASQLWDGVDPATGKAKPAYGYVTPPAPQPISPAPAPTTLGTPGSTDPTLGDQAGLTGIAKTGADIAGSLFPALPDVINDIQGKSDKSALQQLGDAGMSALWFLPFGDIAEGAAAGAEALGLGADAAKTAGVIGTGAATGYAGAVASNLGTGESIPQAATSNVVLPTLAGGALSAAALGAGALYNKFVGQQNAVDKVASIWDDAIGATKSGAKSMSATEGKGLDPTGEFLSNAGILPQTREVNGKLVFNTGEGSTAYQTLTDRISALSDLRDAALDHGPTQDLGEGTTVQYNPPTVNFEDLRQQMLDQASKDYSGTAMQTAQKQINTEMDALKADPKYAIDANGEMSATQTSKIKTYLQDRAGLDKLTNGLQANVFDTMQGVAKKGVEDAAEASGNPDVKAINKIIQQHYNARDVLAKKVDGQTVKGGRLGTYMADIIGSNMGGAVGAAMGGGPLSTIGGGVMGLGVGHLVSKYMQKLATGGPFTAGVFGRMATEEPDVVQRLLQYVGKDAGEAKAIAPLVKPVAATAADRVISAAKASPGSRVYRGMSRPGYIFGAKS